VLTCKWHVLPRRHDRECYSVDPVVLVISLAISAFSTSSEKIISLAAVVRQEVVSIFPAEGSVIRLLIAKVLLTKQSESTAAKD